MHLLELRPCDASVGFLAGYFPLQLQMKSITALADETTLSSQLTLAIYFVHSLPAISNVSLTRMKKNNPVFD